MRKEKEKQDEEVELTLKQRRWINFNCFFGYLFWVIALAASFSFSAILWKADTTWVSELFSFFIFSFLFIQYAAPTVIAASIISAVFLIAARKTPHSFVRKINIVLFMLDLLFLITGIIVAVQLA